MMELAVITGTSRGLGLTIANLFSDKGWPVIGTGRSERPEQLSPNVTYRQFDAGHWTACEALWQETAATYPKARVLLVNNAGGYVGGSLLETDPQAYTAQMNSIYFSAVHMTRGLVKSYPSARIVNVISNSALTAHKNRSAYGAAKAAEMHFFKSLQQELNPEQYQITNLYPSSIASHGPGSLAIDPTDLAEFIYAQASNQTSYYLRDATLFPQTNKRQKTA